MQIPAFLFIAMSIFLCGRFRLSLERPLVMGIVNLTPDSFSNDGISTDVERAVAYARHQLDAGADILDLGAESTRPGAPEVSEEDEIRRLLPVLERIADWGVPISVDTYKPGVMRAAIAAGASLFNDISGLRSPEALGVLLTSDCGVCIMHMQGEPKDMQDLPQYNCVVSEVEDFLLGRAESCLLAGVDRARIALDPGFGFGKAHQHNLALFAALPRLAEHAYPILVGVSRKSMLGSITGKPVEQRQAASVAAAVLAAQRGAKILRVHDVSATRDALAVMAALDQGDGFE